MLIFVRAKIRMYGSLKKHVHYKDFFISVIMSFKHISRCDMNLYEDLYFRGGNISQTCCNRK